MGSDCFSSRSLHTFYFNAEKKIAPKKKKCKKTYNYLVRYWRLGNLNLFVSASNTMSNPYKTCGRRPMDVDRFRRDVIIENEDENDGKGINNPKYYNRGRVVGGSIADYGMHPWQAGIKKVLSYSYIADLCGATIIDEYWVLSAAHCFR